MRRQWVDGKWKLEFIDFVLDDRKSQGWWRGFEVDGEDFVFFRMEIRNFGRAEDFVEIDQNKVFENIFIRQMAFFEVFNEKKLLKEKLLTKVLKAIIFTLSNIFLQPPTTPCRFYSFEKISFPFHLPFHLLPTPFPISLNT